MSVPYPDPITKPFSNTGDNNDPPLGPSTSQANQETGFPLSESTPLNLGGLPVTREEVNGAFNFYTQQILALVAGARYTFNQDVSDEQNGYPMGAVLYCASNNSLQRSLIDNNTFNFITTPAYINDEIHWTAIVIDDVFAQNLIVKTNSIADPPGLLKFFDQLHTHFVSFTAYTILGGDVNFTLPQEIPPAGTEHAFVCDSFGQMYFRNDVDEYTTSTTSNTSSGGYVLITSVTLPKGRYLLNATILATGVSGTPPTVVAFAITEVAPPGNPTDTSITNGYLEIPIVNGTGGHQGSGCIANYQVNIGSPSKTYYLSARNVDGTDAFIIGTLTSICLGKT